MMSRIAALLMCVIGLAASASEWPQIFGPNRDGIYAGKDLSAIWPKEGPKKVWQMKVGAGFSGPAISQGRAILFHREGDKEIIQSLDAKTGAPGWKFDYKTSYQAQYVDDNGPRAVPTVFDGKVYTFGAEGVLNCLNAANGSKVWGVDTSKEFGASEGFFGLACSPLIEGNAVIVNVGGKGAGIVAFDKNNGKVLWKARSEPASYSSPVMASVNKQRLAVFFGFNGLVTLDPANGKVIHTFDWKPPISASVSAADPIVVSDMIFISAAYDLGAVLLRAKGDQVEKVWANDDSLSNQYATSVYRDGFLYGLHGRHDFSGGTELRCVEFKTGKVRWGKPGLGGANVMLAGDQLLVLTENGQLLRYAAQPDAAKETGRAQILSAGVRAYPALADGLLYARSKNQLVCIDLR